MGIKPGWRQSDTLLFSIGMTGLTVCGVAATLIVVGLICLVVN